jgi:pimeloyl-ACP methyl ester carboxylesterase
MLQYLTLLWMCCLVTYCHGSPGGYGGNESMFKETCDYLRSKFRRGFSSSSQSDFDSTTSGEDVNVDPAIAAQQGLRSLSRSLQRKSDDSSESLTHPDPISSPTMQTRYPDDYDDDEYIDQVIDQLTESPGLISNSNNNRFQYDEHLTFSDMYSDDDDDEYDHEGGSFLPVPQVLESLFGRSGRTSSTETTDNSRDNTNNSAATPLQTPVVYRYYSRNRARDVADGSIPFIFLGPNVDHWKVAGQELAARGFSVMAVERVRDEPENSLPPHSSGGVGDEQGGYSPGSDANLILGLLEALRWNKVVLVACDSESALAIRAAMELAPDRVVGLVLCGNLEAADAFVANMYPQNRRLPGSFAVDRFLQSNLRCPFQIVWDGDVPAMPYFSGSGSGATSSEPLQTSHRSLVLGGGSAPHRRRPELFAWVLTRFVEEKIAPTQVSRFKVPRARARGGRQALIQGQQGPKAMSHAPKHPLLLSLSEFLSPGSLVVWGRVVASALLYSTILRIALFQYESVRGGIININTGIEMVASLRKQILGAVTSFLGSVGTLSFLSRGRDKSRDDTEIELEPIKPSRSSEEEAEEREEEQSLVTPPSSEDEEEESSGLSPSSEDEEGKSSALPPSAENEDENQEESSDTEDVEKQEGPAKAPDFNPSFFLDHVIV